MDDVTNTQPPVADSSDQGNNSTPQIGKLWYESKTIWTNVIVLFSFYMLHCAGHGLTGEEQAALLGAINIILRLITNEPIVWK